MEEAEFNKLKKEISEGVKKIHLGGIKGEVLHSHIRAAVTNLHFKWIEKKEMKAEHIIEQLEKDIEQHLVSKAELDLNNSLHLIIRDYIYLYLTAHSMLLYEKRDLEDVQKFAKDFRELCKKKGLPSDLVKQLTDIMDKGINEWKTEIEEFRKIVNAVWAKAEGRQSWALTTFSRMHKEGYFVRYQERKHFKDAVKEASKLEKNEKKLAHVQSKEQLIKEFTSWYDRMKSMTNDFTIVAKLLFNTWEHITMQMGKILDITVKAASIHELPAKDQEQMVELHNTIVGGLNKKFLHALRIDDKQLEAIYQDAKSAVEEARKAA
ncbi:hypothetical protein KY363_07275 [Candidatus Woesearchaeota archaeon]|nr:hypothetical protein [Candidatus Woesearchaeota archaeon]